MTGISAMMESRGRKLGHWYLLTARPWENLGKPQFSHLQCRGNNVSHRLLCSLNEIIPLKDPERYGTSIHSKFCQYQYSVISIHLQEAPSTQKDAADTSISIPDFQEARIMRARQPRVSGSLSVVTVDSQRWQDARRKGRRAGAGVSWLRTGERSLRRSLPFSSACLWVLSQFHCDCSLPHPLSGLILPCQFSLLSHNLPSGLQELSLVGVRRSGCNLAPPLIG